MNTAILIKKDGKTYIFNCLADAKKEACVGDVVCCNGKDWKMPDIFEHEALQEHFRTTKTNTKGNKARLKRLKELTTQMLIWDSAKE